eukprot:COSAG01_NODE_3740_length_5746_cov_2.375421_8_plen_75_part_00
MPRCVMFFSKTQQNKGFAPAGPAKETKGQSQLRTAQPQIQNLGGGGSSQQSKAACVCCVQGPSKARRWTSCYAA